MNDLISGRALVIFVRFSIIPPATAVPSDEFAFCVPINTSFLLVCISVSPDIMPPDFGKYDIKSVFLAYGVRSTTVPSFPGSPFSPSAPAAPVSPLSPFFAFERCKPRLLRAVKAAGDCDLTSGPARRLRLRQQHRLLRGRLYPLSRLRHRLLRCHLFHLWRQLAPVSPFAPSAPFKDPAMPFLSRCSRAVRRSHRQTHRFLRHVLPHRLCRPCRLFRQLRCHLFRRARPFRRLLPVRPVSPLSPLRDASHACSVPGYPLSTAIS